MQIVSSVNNLHEMSMPIFRDFRVEKWYFSQKNAVISGVKENLMIIVYSEEHLRQLPSFYLSPNFSF